MKTKERNKSHGGLNQSSSACLIKLTVPAPFEHNRRKSALVRRADTGAASHRVITTLKRALLNNADARVRPPLGETRLLRQQWRKCEDQQVAEGTLFGTSFF